MRGRQLICNPGVLVCVSDLETSCVSAGVSEWALAPFLRPRVGLAYLVKADTAVTAFHVGCRIEQVRNADILDAVGLGAAMPAFDGRV